MDTIKNSQPSDDNQTKPFQLKLSQLFTFKSKEWLLAWTIGLIAVIATVGLLALSGWFISAAALAGLTLGINAITFDFFRPAAVIRAFAISRTAGRYFERLASHHAVLGLLTDLRVAFFDALAQQKTSFVNHLVQSADSMQRLTHDIDQLDELPLRFWAPWLWALVLQLALLVFVYVFSSSLLWVVALPLFFAGFVIPTVAVFIGKGMALKQTQGAESRRRDLLNPLTASTSLILWNRWRDFQQQFQASDAEYNKVHLHGRRTAMMLNTMQQILLAVCIILLIYNGYPLIKQQVLSLPLLLAYILAVMGLVEMLMPLTNNFTAYGFAIASKDRLNQLVQDSGTAVTTKLTKNSSQNKLPFPDKDTLKLEAKNVSVKFPNALTGAVDVNFTVNAGEVLFIKGRSGAGKSTLLHALAGELDINAGALELNLINTANIDMTNNIGFLAQQLDIFDLTLAENLCVGNPSANDDQLMQALEMVNLKKWVESQPNKLATTLGEYGSQLSGGQARRVALARLLLKPREILLLDEPFAGLDADNAKQVYHNLKNHQKEGILIVVSHQYIPDDVQVLIV